ncbi:MAG TPA: hypothetical protein VGY76_01780 [Solirubrobacteraceae bacterium]|jgi:hypothetical protein|nr:hypothetical protein [Solirubrobacteraceae bacterium]
MTMDPLLADKPTASEQPQAVPSTPATVPAPAAVTANGNGSPYGAMQPPPDPARTCNNCGATLAEDQGWCLQCGTGAPGSLERERDWRPLAALAAAGAILLAGAGTAAYAALSQKPAKPPTHVLIAQVPAAATTTPTAPSTLNTPPPTTTPRTSTLGGALGAGGNGSSRTGLPSSTIRPPKLPAVVPTPRLPSRSTLLPTNTGSTPASEPNLPVKTPTTGATEPTNPASNPILLDTNAASTYNPSGYPASYFGDPALAIDGETSTAWTAQVEPKVAPLMAAGLALDLKTARHLGTLEIHTSTPGMTIEVFGANGSKLPPTILDPAWTKLTPSHLVKKKTASIKLSTGGKAFRFIVLWFTKAPASSPEKVSLGELVLYPPA